VSDERNAGWHLDKKVPISIILALFIQAGVGLLYIADIRKDVEILKVQSAHQITRDDRQDRTTSEMQVQVRSQLERVEAKLDRLIEKQIGQGARP
jgi:hypothetical protein